MMFATLDDLEGSIEMLVFGKALAEYEGALGVDEVVLVRGRVDHGDTRQDAAWSCRPPSLPADAPRRSRQAREAAAARRRRPAAAARPPRRRAPARVGHRRAQARLRQPRRRVGGRARHPHLGRRAHAAARARLSGRADAEPARRARAHPRAGCAQRARRRPRRRPASQSIVQAIGSHLRTATQCDCTFGAAAPRSTAGPGAGGRALFGRHQQLACRGCVPRPSGAQAALSLTRRRANSGHARRFQFEARCAVGCCRRLACPRRRSSRASSISSAVGPSLTGPGVSSTQGRPSKRGSDRNTAQPSLAELALADVRVAVAVGAQRRLAVVEVQRAEAARARRSRRTRRARRPAPAGVRISKPEASRWQESRQTPRRSPPPGRVEQGGQLVERATERAAGAGGVLQVQRAALALAPAPRAMTLPARSIAGATSPGLGRAGVQHDGVRAERVAGPQRGDQRGQRLVADLLSRRRPG